IERLKTEGIINRLKTERLPIRMESMEDIDFYQRIILSLEYNNEVIGYLWVYETKDSLADAVLTVLTRLSTFISKLLYQKLYAEQENYYDVKYDIWKIINNDYLNELQIKIEEISVKL